MLSKVQSCSQYFIHYGFHLRSGKIPALGRVKKHSSVLVVGKNSHSLPEQTKGVHSYGLVILNRQCLTEGLLEFLTEKGGAGKRFQVFDFSDAILLPF